jgi:hypothetical protein
MFFEYLNCCYTGVFRSVNYLSFVETKPCAVVTALFFVHKIRPVAAELELSKTAKQE